jgi:ABC-type amino acid transport substrate-binding protein
MKVYPVAAWFVRSMPGLRILGQVPDAPQPLGIGFDRNNTGLVAAVNHVLTQMQQDKSYQVLEQRWGVT